MSRGGRKFRAMIRCKRSTLGRPRGATPPHRKKGRPSPRLARRLHTTLNPSPPPPPPPPPPILLPSYSHVSYPIASRYRHNRNDFVLRACLIMNPHPVEAPPPRRNSAGVTLAWRRCAVGKGGSGGNWLSLYIELFSIILSNFPLPLVCLSHSRDNEARRRYRDGGG